MKIADVLITYRTAKGMSCRELAKEIGIPHNTLNWIEDRKISNVGMMSRTMLKIIDWLFKEGK